MYVFEDDFFSASLTLSTTFYHSIEISLDSSIWSQTTQFPCRQSVFEPSVPACDYFFHGWQTAPGDSHSILDNTPTQEYALCCPQGVVQFCGSQITGTCNPRLSDSPWRLVYNSGVTTHSVSSITFDMELVPVIVELGTPNCSQTNVDEIRLYINPNVTSALVGVVLGGTDVGYTLQSDPAPYVSIAAGLAYGNTAQVLLQFTSQVSASDVCTLQLGSYSVCNYVLMGQSGQCCTSADVVTSII